MKKLRIIHAIFRRTRTDRVITAYLIWFLVTAAIVAAVEPSIPTFRDGIWYCFTSVTTIGFGDYVASTTIGRVCTILLSIYSLFVFAILTAVITNFFLEVSKLRANESSEIFLDDLKHLEELPPERLAEISEKIRNFEKRRK